MCGLAGFIKKQKHDACHLESVVTRMAVASSTVGRMTPGLGWMRRRALRWGIGGCPPSICQWIIGIPATWIPAVHAGINPSRRVFPDSIGFL